MIGDAYVVDATVHGYNFDKSNFVDSRAATALREFVYPQLHMTWNEEGYRLPREKFERRCPPEMLGSALFRESPTDLACYHGPGLYGYLKDGGSPMDIGLRVAELYPGRMRFYGPVRPFDYAKATNSIDEQIETYDLAGLKLYPDDVWEGELRQIRLNDEKLMYPIYEHAQKRGIKVIAIHKALPMGPVPLAGYAVDDVDQAAYDFPDLQFEVVHAGFAFIEETALLAAFPNVWFNLEGTSALLTVAPARFAQVIGALLAAGAEDRIIWATGCVAVHPRPILEKFWNFEIPAELQAGFGLGKLTVERKRKILGENFARMHGFDLAAEVAALTRSAASEYAEAWSAA